MDFIEFMDKYKDYIIFIFAVVLFIIIGYFGHKHSIKTRFSNFIKNLKNYFKGNIIPATGPNTLPTMPTNQI